MDGLVYGGALLGVECANLLKLSKQGESVAALHEAIARELRRAIDGEEYTVGALLPSEAELAARYGVSRGTVRQAVATLTAEGLVGSRQGARRVVLASRRSQSFSELRSFAQWARAMDRSATGSVISSKRRPATEEDAARLHLRAGAEVLHVLRVRGLDGELVLLERTVYADWIAPAIERIEPDCESVTQRLYEDVGLTLAYGEHLIDAVAAGTRDVELLGVRRGSPLLRVRRVTTTRTGRPVEWSDDRYRSDAVNFSIHNSIGSNPLARQAGPGLGG
jgi:GntR family transcriptional regulator